jgi:excisionase family DNA binding protein
MSGKGVMIGKDDGEEKRMRTGMQMATVREVAAFLRLKESTVCSLVSHGKLPGFKFGKSWRFDLKRIERLFAGNKSGEDRPVGDHNMAEVRYE